MGSRHLYLHIGYYKTGTTALQGQLGQHQRDLQRQGVLYPSTGWTSDGSANHSAVAFQMLQEAGAQLPPWFRRSMPSAPAELDALRRRLIDEVAGSSAASVVLSSEEFVRFARDVPSGSTARFLEELNVDHVTVVCYLRRPDLYLDSWYNQMIKIGSRGRRLTTNMDFYLGSIHTNFARTLRYWKHDVGCDDLVVCNYGHATGGIVAHFADTLAVDVPAATTSSDANPRINNNFIEWVRVRNLASPPGKVGYDAAVREVLETIENDRRRLPPLRTVSMFNARARRRLYDHTTSLNGELQELLDTSEDFFPDADAILDVPDGAVTDVAAFRFWAPYINSMLAGRGQAPDDHGATGSRAPRPSFAHVGRGLRRRAGALRRSLR